ncbi:MAG: electron transporter RnfE [Bacteroidetes bacterium HGW-Bacteroidetes-18]|nr:MAG: electron transporter RnfE [Bacteroidetes bacterium HGW-Bacteroidetes-18]
MHGDYWGMWIIPVLFVVLIIFLTRNNNVQSQNETPLGILKKRYAKGEITKEQYEEMKKNIL